MGTSFGGLRELAVSAQGDAGARIGRGSVALLRGHITVISDLWSGLEDGEATWAGNLVAQLLLLAVPVPLVDLLALKVEELCQVLDQVHRPVRVLLEA